MMMMVLIAEKKLALFLSPVACTYFERSAKARNYGYRFTVIKLPDWEYVIKAVEDLTISLIIVDSALGIPPGEIRRSLGKEEFIHLVARYMQSV